MKKLLLAVVMAAFIIPTVSAVGQKPLEIKLYAPGEGGSNGVTEKEKKSSRGFISNISEASMSVYLPDAAKSNGQFVIVCPGGGYKGLAWRTEGTEVALWLNKQGIAAGILKSRVPNGHHDIPLMDAQRALEIVRDNAKEWGVKRDQIGMIGFSAGGHLAASAATFIESRSARPDFIMMIYPVVTMDRELTHKGSRELLLGDDPSPEMEERYSMELQVKRNTPPCFIASTYDDKVVDVRNSLLFFNALKAEDVNCEMHIYPSGGHGWGFYKPFAYRAEFESTLKRWLAERLED